MSGSVVLQLGPHDNAEALRARVATAKKAGFAGLDWTTPSTPDGKDDVAPDTEDHLAVESAFHLESGPPLELPVAVVSARCASTRSYDALDRVSAAIADTSALGAAILCLTLPPLGRDTRELAFASYQDALNLSYRVLHDLRTEAAASGVVLALEVPQRGYFLSPVETRELIDEANAWNVGVCVDLDRIAEIGLPADWLRTLGSRVHAIRIGTNGAHDPKSNDTPRQVADALPEIKALLARDHSVILSRDLPESHWATWLKVV